MSATATHLKLPSLLVAGTDTGVGKTVVTALLAIAYRGHGVAAAPFKPVAAGVSTGEVWADTAFLAAAARTSEEETGLYRLKKPLSPHLAAADEGVCIDIAAVMEKFNSLSSKYGAVLVEGAGGIMAPLGAGATFLDMAAALDLPVVIVTTARLGSLNHTLLTADACRERGLKVAGLVINRFPAQPGEPEQRNLAELGKLTGTPLIAVLPEMDVSVEDLNTGDLERHAGLPDLAELPGGLSGRGDYSRAIEADRKHVWHPFSPMREYLGEKPHPLMIVGGQGSRLTASDGRSYIDGTSSLWVNIHGHGRPELDGAVRRQLGRVAHSTLLGLSNEPSALLAEQLSAITPAGLDRVFYSDNGSTAVEVALKVAFQYWRQAGHPEKKEFVSFVNAYHGDTIGSVSVGGHELFHSMFRPLLFDAHLAPAAYCYRCPEGLAHPECRLACLSGLKEILARRSASIAAVIVEPRVQGAAGIIVQPPGYLAEVEKLCRRHGVLLVADEVATGFGRTGTMFACEQEGVEPDIMALAKGITGGYLPLAATLFREEIYEAFLGRYEELRTFFHGHTYTGNPLACAAALANIELIRQPGFLERVREKAKLFDSLLARLAGLRHAGDVRRIGMMAGIELVAGRGATEPFPVKERVGRRVILKAREKGVIIRPLGDTVVIMPPLSIGEGELRHLVEAASWAIEEVTERGNG
ncbi:MAG: adenosylmethionine--8-amino-7-oxononanoate transaminase [Thermoleophilia bacterium]|nr:adenosylmethionine--8-amino-7-oxononanoate transaminase [Thermoleophilia bacterium]